VATERVDKARDAIEQAVRDAHGRGVPREQLEQLIAKSTSLDDAGRTYLRLVVAQLCQDPEAPLLAEREPNEGEAGQSSAPPPEPADVRASPAPVLSPRPRPAATAPGSRSASSGAHLAPVPDGGPVPPQNLEAEENVLGAAMLLHDNAIAAVRDIVDAGDFYRESHARIYRAALELHDSRRPRRRDHAHQRARAARRARRVGGRVRCTSSPRSSPPPRTPPTTRGSSRDGDAARPHPRRRRDRTARLGPAGDVDSLARAALEIANEEPTDRPRLRP
jgi:hypothetical protein